MLEFLGAIEEQVSLLLAETGDNHLSIAHESKSVNNREEVNEFSSQMIDVNQSVEVDGNETGG